MRPRVSPRDRQVRPNTRAAAKQEITTPTPRRRTTRTSIRTASFGAEASSNETLPEVERRHSSGDTSRKIGGGDIDSERPAKIAKTWDLSGRRRSLRRSNTDLTHETNGTTSLQASPLSSEQDEVASAGSTASEASNRQNEVDMIGTPDVPEQTAPEAAEASAKAEPNVESRADHNEVQTEEPARRHSDSPAPSNNQEQPVPEEHLSDDNERADILKRLPGRRRAPHNDPRVEADLRRQLELKVAYRAVAKALKPILAELADRTAKELKENENLHLEHESYHDVQAELDSRLKQRLYAIKCHLAAELKLCETTRDVAVQTVNDKFTDRVTTRQEDLVAECHGRLMSLDRRARHDADEEETEDEDEAIPRNTYRLEYRTGDRIRLARGYCSRTRYYLETERLWDDFETRIYFRKMQRDFDPESLQQKPSPIAVFDGDHRRKALAQLNILNLIKASNHTEQEIIEKPQATSLPNEEAVGLQALVTASEMKSQPTDPPRKPTEMSPKELEAPPLSHPLQRPEKPLLQSDALVPAQANQSSIPITFMSKQRTPKRQRKESKLPQEGASTKKPRIQKEKKRNGNPATPQPGKPARRPSSQQPPLNILISNIKPESPTTLEQPAPENNARGTHTSHEHPAQVQSLQSPTATQPEINTIPLPQVPASTAPETKPDNAPVDSQELSKPRKRPGPRPQYAMEKERLPGQQLWSPFTNSLGPPTYIPKYVKDTGLLKRVGQATPGSPEAQKSPGADATSAAEQGNKSPGERVERYVSKPEPVVHVPNSLASTANTVRLPSSHISHLNSPIQANHSPGQASPPPQPTAHGAHPTFAAQQLHQYQPPLFPIYPQHWPPNLQPPPLLVPGPPGGPQGAPHPGYQPIFHFQPVSAPQQQHPPPHSQVQSSAPPQHTSMQLAPPTYQLPPGIIWNGHQFVQVAQSPPIDRQPPQENQKGNHQLILPDTRNSGQKANHQPILPATMNPNRRPSQANAAFVPPVPQPSPHWQQSGFSMLAHYQPHHQWQHYIAPAPTQSSVSQPQPSPPPLQQQQQQPMMQMQIHAAETPSRRPGANNTKAKEGAKEKKRTSNAKKTAERTAAAPS